MKLNIGSRGSQLALYQANLIKTFLAAWDVDGEIKIIKTTGDKIDYLSFDKIEGKGFFTKELEEALLAGEIDLAVHSLKDLSTQMPPGLRIGAYCNPEDPSELLLVRPEAFDESQKLYIKKGGTLGTSSVRRQAQAAHFRPDLKIEPLRGNVPTRIQKLKEGRFDAILLARAGVERLKIDTGDLKRIVLDRFEFIPAPGQGILAIEIRDNDPNTGQIVAKLNEPQAEATAKLERGLLARFDGGCQLPLAVTSEKRDGKFFLKAFLGQRSSDGWSQPAVFAGAADNVIELQEEAYRALSGVDAKEPQRERAKILITRSREEAESLFLNFSDKLTPVYYPDFAIVPEYDSAQTRSILERLTDFDWIIFTSKNSARIFDKIIEDNSLTIDSRTKVAAVGRKTAEYLEFLEWKVAFYPMEESSLGLLKELPQIIDGDHKSILLPLGIEAPEVLQNGLKALGHNVQRLNIYRTMPADKNSLPSLENLAIEYYIFTAPLTVQFFKELGNRIPRDAWVAAIGNPTAEALREHFRAPDYIPPKADLSEIIAQILERIDNGNI